ncbi:MAG: hypothetical protein LAO79_16275 [Acidobacteriia bacterium]|nr:hypothetical protein [Terriglobia bacterium]
MKLFLFLAAALVTTSAASALDLGGIKTVYLLPMSNGLDQYLAIKLTTGVILQVVTDPQKADAILTDHVGGSLESKLDELYGEKPKQDSEDIFAVQKPISQPLARARGAIFLVDRKSRNIVWSDYERPKNTTPAAINQLAEKIASKLAKDTKGK